MKDMVSIPRSELEYLLANLERASDGAQKAARQYTADPERQAAHEAGALRGEIKFAAIRLRSLLGATSSKRAA